MDDLIILHLSDLHIDSKGRKYSNLLKELLADIKDQSSLFPDGRVAVVITGDVINQGNKAAVKNAKLFFKGLKEALKEKIAGLYIVPGNHDKYRTDANRFLIPSYRSIMDNKVSYNVNHLQKGDIRFDSSFAENIWSYQEKAYEESGYFELLDYIYGELFPEFQEIKQIARKTYGVHVLNVAGKQYCFVLLNTAWSSIDDKDVRHLILGEFQVDSIYEKFCELTDEANVELTFVLGHHPLECFYGNEQDRLFDKMISFNGMSANAYICGHTHDRTVVNWSNNRHAIYTLVTGIGWPEVDGNHVHDHYYSIYCFNLNLGSMEILVKNSYDNGKFKIDPRIYTGQDIPSENILTRPIRFHEETGGIVFHAGLGVSPKVMYATSNFLEYCSEFARKLMEISTEAQIWLEEDKEDFYNNYDISVTNLIDDTIENLDGLLYDHMASSNLISFDEYECDNTVVEVMKANAIFIYDKFQGYLQKLCDKLEQKLVGNVAQDQVVRFHCRYLERSTYCYQELCTSFSHEEYRDKYNLSDIEYGDLIEAIMRSTKSQSGCLIYSINEKLCKNKLKERWRDFITIIPQIQENIHSKREIDGKERKAPFLTFGVTINSEEQEYILYCMDYLSMDVVLGNILQIYIHTFLIDLGKFCMWIKMDTKKEAIEYAGIETVRK